MQVGLKSFYIIIWKRHHIPVPISYRKPPARKGLLTTWFCAFASAAFAVAVCRSGLCTNIIAKAGFADQDRPFL